MAPTTDSVTPTTYMWKPQPEKYDVDKCYVNVSRFRPLVTGSEDGYTSQ